MPHSNNSSVGFRQENLSIKLGGELHEAPVDLIVGEPEGDDALFEVMLLPGYGEAPKGTARVAKALSDMGIRTVATFLPLDKFPADPAWYTAVVTEGLEQVASDRDLFVQDQGVRTITHSAGSAMWAISRNKAPELYGNAALLAPAGVGALDPSWRVRSTQDKRMSLLGRYAQNGLKFADLSDVGGTLGAVAETSVQISSDVANRRILTKFGMLALDKNLPQAIIEHAENNYVSLTLGTSDVLAAPPEALRSLEEARYKFIYRFIPLLSKDADPHIDIYQEDIAHVHFRMQQGVEQVQKAAAWHALTPVNL
jgi:hypothetical protein